MLMGSQLFDSNGLKRFDVAAGTIEVSRKNVLL